VSWKPKPRTMTPCTYRPFPSSISPDIYSLQESEYPSHLYTKLQCTSNTVLRHLPQAKLHPVRASTPRARVTIVHIFHDYSFYRDDAPTIYHPLLPAPRKSCQKTKRTRLVYNCSVPYYLHCPATYRPIRESPFLCIDYRAPIRTIT